MGRRRAARVWRGVEYRRRSARRRLAAVILLFLAIGAFVTGLWVGGSDGASSSGHGRGAATRLMVGRRTVLVASGSTAAARRAEIYRRLDPHLTIRRGAAAIDYRLGVAAAARAVGSSDRPVLQIPRVAVASRIRTPIVTQKLHNNCETAALEALLTTVGHREEQLRLQAALPTSPPLDPRDTASGRVWGDPDRGFVGRADGGGTAGGFGVYPGPIADLAARGGVKLRSLSRESPRRVYGSLLAGHAVMAWVGLSDGPRVTWRSFATGRRIYANMNEHVVVLSGLTAGGAIRVMNPLTGTRELWAKPQFETMWARLGRRALST